MTITTFGPVDARSLTQLKTCMASDDAGFGVLCADHHPGDSPPIGGAVAYENHISPSGVGDDIGCGNKAVQTDLRRYDLPGLGVEEAVMDAIVARVSFGMGVPARERVDHPGETSSWPVLDVLGARSELEVHHHRNDAWRESHGGRDHWVVRKGCTPAWPGQLGFVGASMGEPAVVLEGVDSAQAVSELRSTVHGAGRVMSRPQAAGRSRRGTVERPGRVDWPAVQARLAADGIVLHGGGADGAPEVYKRLRRCSPPTTSRCAYGTPCGRSGSRWPARGAGPLPGLTGRRPARAGRLAYRHGHRPAAAQLRSLRRRRDAAHRRAA